MISCVTFKMADSGDVPDPSDPLGNKGDGQQQQGGTNPGEGNDNGNKGIIFH